MNTELPSKYDPSSVEAQAYKVWIDEGCFSADPSRPGPSYTIVIPPPNVTGALHLGHAINNTLQDILTRMHRMAGFNTLWVPGIDHAGIATQAVVERQLKEQENKTRHDVGREGLVERIWQWKQQYGDRILEQLKRLGASCDWTRTRFTLDEMCAAAVRETFFKLFKDGLIYRGKRLVNWDTFLQTSISDDEIYHETVKTNLWHLRYPIEGSDKVMIVATTRPETMLGDTAVAVHSEDPRWNWAIGKHVRLPLTNRLIPIIADDILVDPKFGTGVVKVTPAHDPNDYAVWQRHQGKADQIDIINILTSDGKINADRPEWAKYTGLKRDAARKVVVEDLNAAGLLEKEEPYETQVGHSDRSKTAIEPYLSDQWFVKMAPLAEPALQAVRDGKIKFYPERHAQQYLSWLGEKRDWPVSRQLWWGHRIPVWRHDAPPAELTAWLKTQSSSRVCVNELEGAIQICTNDPAIAKKIETWGAVQDPDVLDTWFSSALWPHSTLGWPEENAFLKRYYPTSVLLTGRDIITLWVARMVMTGLYNMGDIPFRDVAINPTILDGKGERMSKSKGNGVDPVDIIEGYGADALRFTLTKMATETQDVRMPVKKDAQGRNTSEKFDEGRNFCNKLWNACRFALSNLENVKPAAGAAGSGAGLTLPDRWILARFHRTVTECDEALKAYRFDAYAIACYKFFWNDFCDWYVEAIKPAMKDPARATQTAEVLAAVIDGSLRLMHPMIPFITEIVWWRLNDVRPARGVPGKLECSPSKRLVLASWPKAQAAADEAEQIFPRLQELIVSVRTIRNDYQVNPKQAVPVSLKAPGDLIAAINANRELIELLGTCTLKAVEANLAPVANAVVATAAGCDVYVEGLIDPNAEKVRLAKELESKRKSVEALKGRLGNEAYISKAPPHLVQQTKDQLAAAEAEVAKLDEALRKLS